MLQTIFESAKRLVIATVVAIAGKTRCIQPLKPNLPSIFLFDVEVQRSPGFSLSVFIARLTKQLGSRHSKSALRKI